MSRPPLAFWLVGLFIIVPIAEIYVIIQVGQWIGAVPTVLLLVVESLIGAWVVRREGRRAWEALRDTIRAGTVPGRELIDGALVLIGGTLLLTPGFITDIVGFFFVLPFTRPFARRLVQLEVNRRVARRAAGPYAPRRGGAHQIYRDDDPYL
jgi:UPF0716 protein FxsA